MSARKKTTAKRAGAQSPVSIEKVGRGRRGIAKAAGKRAAKSVSRAAATPRSGRRVREGGTQRKVFYFGGGRADGDASMKESLGGKGANLAEMTSLGIPVPPGFTISTEVCAGVQRAGQEAAR